MKRHIHKVLKYSYRIRSINETSLPYYIIKERKQVISLLPILSEKQGATYVFSLKHGSDGK